MAAGQQVGQAGTQLERGYTREEVTRCLTVLAFCNGRPGTAIRELKRMGATCPTQPTLKKWRERHADIYEDAVSRLDEAVIPELDEAVRSQIIFQKQAYDRLLDNIDEMELGQLSNAARNAAVGSSIGIEKSQLLRGQPTQITEQRDPAKLIKELQDLARLANASADVDSTAEEDE
jgi:hypothetical protein